METVPAQSRSQSRRSLFGMMFGDTFYTTNIRTANTDPRVFPLAQHAKKRCGKTISSVKIISNICFSFQFRNAESTSFLDNQVNGWMVGRLDG